MKRSGPPLWLLLAVFPLLACQAAMRLVSPPGDDLVRTLPPTTRASSATPTAEPSCLTEIAMILGEANNEHLPLRDFPGVDAGSSLDVPLVAYDVQGDRLSAPALANVPPELVPYQRDFGMQKDAWGLFTAMIPAEDRLMLAQFEIMTDGPGGILSAVEQTVGDPTRWVLETDIADVPDRKNLAFTLLHEYGHLLTLNNSQVPPDLRVFNDPNSTHVRERAATACSTYFPGEGCSLPSSYVNSFYSKFWTELYGEWHVIDQMDDPDRREARLHSFYHKYRDQFVDSYAASSPVEDIAETWAYFILSPRPAYQSISDQKLEFFYNYPELVDLRQHIRGALCTVRP